MAAIRAASGGYGCGPGERWSESRYRCVPRRGGSGGIYIDLGGIGGNIGISNKRRCGHGTYWDGDRCVARGGGDDYGYRGGGGDYGIAVAAAWWLLIVARP